MRDPRKKRRGKPPRRSVRRSSPRPNSAGPTVFQVLLDSLDTGVALVTLEGKILYANARFSQLFGIEPHKNLAGTLLRNYVWTGNWPSLFTALQQASKAAVEGEVRISKGESSQALRLSFAPLEGTGARKIRIAATEETELLETTKALKQSEASLHEVSLQLLKTQDEERRSMARDLHDVTGQELAAAVVMLDRLSRNVDATELRANLEETTNWVRKVEGEIRTLSYVLHPPLLDEMGIGTALGIFVKGFAKRTGIDVNLEIAGDLPRLPVEKETGLFRVIQECLTNVFRHSGSHRAWVRLSLENGVFKASVRDEGKGMPGRRNGKNAQHGVGMQSMAGRLRLMDGGFEINSNGHGTEIIASVPLEKAEADGGSAGETGEGARGVKAAEQRTGRSRVLIVDDHEIARRGLKALLKDEADFEICGEAENGLEAVTKAEKLRPDLIIMDLTMPHVSGFSAANRIRQLGLEPRILVYTTHSYPELEKMAHATGCHGFVLKSNANKDLLRGARAVLRGDEFYSTLNPMAQTAAY